MHARPSNWWLFDDQGGIWAAGSTELRRKLLCLHGGDLVADVVRNLGFVAVRKWGNRTIIRLHVQVVSSVALANVFYWLFDHTPASVLIDFIGEDRPAELCASTDATIDRLIALTQRNDLSRKIAERTCRVDELSAETPLRGLLEIWEKHDGRYNASALIRFASEHLRQRFLVIRQSTSDQLLFDTIGDGLHVPDKTWFKSAIGNPIEKQPDTEYWQWVAQVHRSTLHANLAVLSDIDTDIYWPARGWVRRKYRRLLLPCTAPDGTRFLFSANSSESGVALRGEVA